METRQCQSRQGQGPVRLLGKVGLKPGCQKDRPPGGRDHMVKCKEKGAGGQRDDCRVGRIHGGKVRADVEKAGDSEV